MQFPLTLYLHALDPKEVTLLRKIVIEAKDAGLFEQKRFMGEGGDVRNFLKTERSRPSPGLLVTLYEWVMTELAPAIEPDRQSKDSKAAEHLSLSEKITQLFDAGINSPRYVKDVSVAMNKFIVGDVLMNKFIAGNILKYNVSPFEQRFFIGYRFRTERRELLRFLVHVSFEKSLGRTLFWSYLRLNDSEFGHRETRGFAHAARGNLYFSGFINGHLGCEFMALTAPHVSHIYSGLVTTTSPDRTPVAKACALIEASRTHFKDRLPQDPTSSFDYKNLRHHPGLGMIPIPLDKIYKKSSKGFSDRLAELLRETEGLEESDSIRLSRYLSRRMMRVRHEIPGS